MHVPTLHSPRHPRHSMRQSVRQVRQPFPSPRCRRPESRRGCNARLNVVRPPAAQHTLKALDAPGVVDLLFSCFFFPFLPLAVALLPLPVCLLPIFFLRFTRVLRSLPPSPSGSLRCNLNDECLEEVTSTSSRCPSSPGWFWLLALPDLRS